MCFLASFFNESELFSKTWGPNKSKNKPKFLNVNFFDTLCICSRKNGGNRCLCFNTSYFTYFWYSLCRKLTKSLASQGFGEIFTHAVWLISPDTPHFSLTIFRKIEILWFSYAKPWREVRFVKYWFIECLHIE